MSQIVLIFIISGSLSIIAILSDILIKTKRKGKGFIIALFILGIFCVVFVLSVLPDNSIPKNTQILGVLSEARNVMTYFKIHESNYDNFTCKYEGIKQLCEVIHRRTGKELIITHDAINNSQSTCIYSSLIYGEKNYWYCADSKGYAGYSSMNPGTNGYCVDGKSATCPPVSENIP